MVVRRQRVNCVLENVFPKLISSKVGVLINLQVVSQDRRVKVCEKLKTTWHKLS